MKLSEVFWTLTFLAIWIGFVIGMKKKYGADANTAGLVIYGGFIAGVATLVLYALSYLVSRKRK